MCSSEPWVCRAPQAICSDCTTHSFILQRVITITLDPDGTSLSQHWRLTTLQRSYDVGKNMKIKIFITCREYSHYLAFFVFYFCESVPLKPRLTSNWLCNQDDLELLILPPSSLRCWDYRHVPPSSVYMPFLDKQNNGRLKNLPSVAQIRSYRSSIWIGTIAKMSVVECRKYLYHCSSFKSSSCF